MNRQPDMGPQFVPCLLTHRPPHLTAYAVDLQHKHAGLQRVALVQ